MEQNRHLAQLLLIGIVVLVWVQIESGLYPLTVGVVALPFRLGGWGNTLRSYNHSTHLLGLYTHPIGQN